MKITISGGDAKIERVIAAAKHEVEHLPLMERRRRVADLVAKNRRKQWRVVDGGATPKP